MNWARDKHTINLWICPLEIKENLDLPYHLHSIVKMLSFLDVSVQTFLTGTKVTDRPTKLKKQRKKKETKNRQMKEKRTWNGIYFSNPELQSLPFPYAQVKDWNVYLIVKGNISFHLPMSWCFRMFGYDLLGNEPDTQACVCLFVCLFEKIQRVNRFKLNNWTIVKRTLCCLCHLGITWSNEPKMPK